MTGHQFGYSSCVLADEPGARVGPGSFRSGVFGELVTFVAPNTIPLSLTVMNHADFWEDNKRKFVEGFPL